MASAELQPIRNQEIQEISMKNQEIISVNQEIQEFLSRQAEEGILGFLDWQQLFLDFSLCFLDFLEFLDFRKPDTLTVRTRGW